MRGIAEYLSMVSTAIENLNYPLDTHDSLYAPIIYALASGGKRLRPVLTLMACEACGGNPENAVKAAVGLEMFHNFTLLHDDVMDKSDMRRGRQTVHVKWNENTAILSGDTMLTLATQLVSDVPDMVLRKVLTVFNRMALDVYEGQQLDMDFEKRFEVSHEEYIEMITGKTSALLGAAAKIGALIAGASSETCNALYEYGVALGLAFQIQDDYLDLYGDSTTFGKPIGGDVLNGKKTFLTISALSLNSPEQNALKQALKMPPGDIKICKVRDLYTSMNIPVVCRDAIDLYSTKAMNALDVHGISEEGKIVLTDVVNRLIDRRK